MFEIVLKSGRIHGNSPLCALSPPNMNPIATGFETPQSSAVTRIKKKRSMKNFIAIALKVLERLIRIKIGLMSGDF